MSGLAQVCQLVVPQWKLVDSASLQVSGQIECRWHLYSCRCDLPEVMVNML